MIYQVAITKTAEKDLMSIRDYISIALQEPNAAKRQIQYIREAIFALQMFPERYPLVKDMDLAHKGYRMIPVDYYMVLYRIDKDQQRILISRILYGKREWRQLL